jgi:hypothetical protein
MERRLAPAIAAGTLNPAPVNASDDRAGHARVQRDGIRRHASRDELGRFTGIPRARHHRVTAGTIMLDHRLQASSVFQVTGYATGYARHRFARRGGANPAIPPTIWAIYTARFAHRAAADRHLLRRQRSV